MLAFAHQHTPDDAAALLQQGATPAPTHLDKAELAAWMLVANAVLSVIDVRAFRAFARVRRSELLIALGCTLGVLVLGPIGGLVLAFEPQSVPRSVSTVASFFRRQRNIVQFPFALGHEPGLLDLKIPIKRKGDIGISLAHVGAADDLAERFDVRREIVPCDTLDNVLSRISIKALSMIKIDVEGGEHNVLRGGIETLKDELEPTMLVIPDAIKLPEVGTCIAVQQAMLKHCGDEMKNRFAILDIYDGDQPQQPDDPVAQFRNLLGVNNLNFGAAYYP